MSLLLVVKSVIVIILLYVFIQRSPGMVPPIIGWMAFNVIYGTLGALIGTFIGPMVYDYMRRSQMGTIGAGSGVMGGLVQLGAGVLGAQWAVYYSAHIHHPAGIAIEYSSIYLLQLIICIPILLAKLYFVRIVTTGKLKKWGTLEVENPQEVLVEEQAAHVLED